MDIRFPSKSGISHLAKFSVDLRDAEEKEEFRIGAGHVSFLRPTCMIYLAMACRQRSRMYPDEQLIYNGLNKLDYANNMGFSELLKLKDKPYVQGAFGGKNYIPIRAMSREGLVNDSKKYGIEFGDAVTKRCGKISGIVCQGRSEQLKEVLTVAFREIFRNCFEHGEANNAVYCAQYWPKLGIVEICISDRGIGVNASLSESKHSVPSNDEEAVQLALMPGVSSKAWRHKKKKSVQKTHWDNSGHGLFLAHQVFGKLGHFYLASGSSSVFLSPEEFKILPCSVDGTLVSMRMSLNDENKIHQAIAEVGDLAKKVKERLGVKGLDIESVKGFLRSGLQS